MTGAAPSGGTKDGVILSLSKDLCEAPESAGDLGDIAQQLGTQRSFDKLKMT
jgi:hypothetical protein